VFGTASTVEGQREQAKIIKMGKVEDLRPWDQQVHTCPHEGCKARFLGSAGWLPALPSDLSRVTEEKIRERAGCRNHAGEGCVTVEVTRKRLSIFSKTQAANAQAEAARKRREAEAQARREEAAGAEMMESLRRRCRR
jgi:hypothetical protein